MYFIFISGGGYSCVPPPTPSVAACFNEEVVAAKSAHADVIVYSF